MSIILDYHTPLSDLLAAREEVERKMHIEIKITNDVLQNTEIRGYAKESRMLKMISVLNELNAEKQRLGSLIWDATK